MPRDTRPGSVYAQKPATKNIYEVSGAPGVVKTAARVHAPTKPNLNLTGGGYLPTIEGVTNLGLGLLGTSTGYVAKAATHPVAAVEGKLGTRTVKLAGKSVPTTEGVFPWPSPAKKVADVAQAVADASKAARAQGHGVRASVPTVPKVEPGAETAATGGTAGAQVREGLKGAKPIRSKQEAGYSAERAKRAGSAEQAMQEQGGVAGYHAALGELKGELPKLNFQGFAHFDQDALDAMFTHVQQHPGLRPYEKITVQSSILKAVGGKVPTQSEQKLLERAFGRDATAQIVASIPFWKKAAHVGGEVLNIPRAVMASFDLSAPFRQGLMVGVSHPGMFFKNFAPMVKAFGSENVYRSMMNDIYDRETYPLMQKAKLSITDIGEDRAGVPLSQREEQFPSNYAERIPIAGRGVRASGRAYTGFLNKTRADVFDHLIRAAAEQGHDINDQHVLESIARFVNSATGRGDLGVLKSAAVPLNTILFSPRLMMSRLNFMNPIYYARLDPFARKEALKAALGLVGTMSTVLYLAKLGGAEVNLDPRNADFAKIKIGNTRIDVAGGFQQYVRLLAQIQQGKIVSSTTGKTLTLGPQGPGHLSRKDIVQRFIEGKYAPVPSLVNDWAKGTDFADKPFAWKRAALQRMIPLLAQDASDLNHADGPAAAIGGYALGAFGFGIQTYGPKPIKSNDSYGGTTGTGGSVYAGNSGGGGSVYAGG